MDFVGRRVLVVEDEFLIALTTIDLLESVGCETVGPAARLSEAVQLAQSEALDAALLDIDIAGEVIWPVADELQRRGVPFAFVSAYPRMDVIPARFAGAPRLDKPLETNRLLGHLSALWGSAARESISLVEGHLG
jgi:CheY-like chemotaxis protein